MGDNILANKRSEQHYDLQMTTISSFLWLVGVLSEI